MESKAKKYLDEASGVFKLQHRGPVTRARIITADGFDLPIIRVPDDMGDPEWFVANDSGQQIPVFRTEATLNDVFPLRYPSRAQS